MQHHPHIVGLIEAELDEVVAAAERAKLARDDGLQRILASRHEFRMALIEPGRELAEQRSDRAAIPLPGLVAVEADRDGVLDLRPNLRQRIGQMLGPRPGEPNRGHTAADVDANCSRDDRAHRRDHAADRRAPSPVHVRHDRDVPVDEGQPRDVLDLPARGILDRHPARPRLDRDATRLDLLERAHVVLLGLRNQCLVRLSPVIVSVDETGGISNSKL
jgi:hypothetical protein